MHLCSEWTTTILLNQSMKQITTRQTDSLDPGSFLLRAQVQWELCWEYEPGLWSCPAQRDYGAVCRCSDPCPGVQPATINNEIIFIIPPKRADGRRLSMLRKREFYGYQLSALFVNVIHLRYLEECEVADDDVPVLVPGVDQDSTPGCVFVQDDLSLTGVA